MPALARRQTLAERLGMSEPQLELIRRMAVHPDAPDDVVELYLAKCRAVGTDPLDRLIYCIPRRQNVKDERTGEWRSEIRWTLQGSIDLFRSIAENSGDYAGQLGPFWSNDGETWRDTWLDAEPPKVCRIGVLRQSFKEPLWVTGTYEYYVPRDGKGNPSPTTFWKGEKGAHQLAKCVEELALRKAFPRKLHGVYGTEEMAQAPSPAKLPKREVLQNDEAIDGEFAAIPAGPPPLPSIETSQTRSAKPDEYRRKAGMGAVHDLCKRRHVDDPTYREWLVEKFGVDKFVDKETGEVKPTSKVLDVGELEQLWLFINERTK